MVSRHAMYALVLSVGITCSVEGTQPTPKPVFLYASLSGRPTFDVDAKGGNPFASALVQLLERPSLSFRTFKTDLIVLTREASSGRQRAEVVGGEHLSMWQFLPKPPNQIYVALVVVFSNYSGSTAGPSLPGAKRDLLRISKAFCEAGFVVTLLADPDEKTLEETLKEFRRHTARADVAVIYTTGHGVEADGISRILIPYTAVDRDSALSVPEKIDRFFIDGIDRDRKRRAVVRALIEMSGDLGTRIIAEGVEREEERQVLEDLGVTLAQGWLFGKPHEVIG